MFDVAIIGAGVVGAMVAKTLAAYDLKICIIEKENDVAMGATKANSAIVHAGFDAKEGSLKAKLNVKGSEMMQKICSDLGVKYSNNGSIVAGYNKDDEKMLETLLKRGEKNGVKGLKIISGDEVRKLEPNLSERITCALWAPTGAIVCPYELTVAAVGNAMDNGAEFKRNFEVKEIANKEDFFEIKSDNEIVESKTVINCAGVFSDKIAEMVGDNSFSITPRKGEYILLDREVGGIVKSTIFKTPDKMGKGILVSPTVDGNLLTGPTSKDIEDKEENTTTSQGFEEIINGTNEKIKNNVFRSSITSFCGIRAVGSTGDFIINMPHKGFVNVAGIESPGLSASPAIALYVKDILEKSGLTLKEKENYISTRKPAHYFKEASIEEKNEIIKRDKAFGKIVCRCEGITEGEISEALRTNPKPVDMDGVKRRTRAQMGRCQGGFCSPVIMEMISRELKIPFEEVTKNGKGSYLTTGKTKEADR